MDLDFIHNVGPIKGRQQEHQRRTGATCGRSERSQEPIQEPNPLRQKTQPRADSKSTRGARGQLAEGPSSQDTTLPEADNKST